MLDEEELECLKYVQRLRRYANRQLPTAPAATPTTVNDESKPELKKRGRKRKAVHGQVIDVEIEPASPDETPPSLFVLELSHIGILQRHMITMLVYFELLAKHIVRVIVLLRLGMPYCC